MSRYWATTWRREDRRSLAAPLRRSAGRYAGMAPEAGSEGRQMFVPARCTVG